MPSMYNVPHIVGDDDDLSEAEEQMPVVDAIVNSPEDARNSQGEKSSRSTSSDLSESFSDKSSDADGEASTNSSADEDDVEEEEEEEDWSNNISYIDRTPDYQMSQETSGFNGSNPMDINDESYLSEEYDDGIKSGQDTNAYNAVVHCVQPICAPDSVYEKEAEKEIATEGGKVVVKLPKRKQKLSKTLDVSSASSRRSSLRSARRMELAKAAPQAKGGRGRKRKSKARNDGSPAATIGARVAKRPRHSVPELKSPNVMKPPVEHAKPVEVTEYFTNISATLVHNRVTLMPFLSMRKRIDRMVGEAIAKTKMQLENNSVDSI